ncbi:hypothetical protein [uncultured Psychroserpens sp.]|uniref:hypothetical protein n=1 Tax=uncultured Psychroserpens sp. TaxID=255436 RepID=UPI002635FD35|nr:hypothetical protein [uncultured Psychroserpens sp.]
MPNIDNDIYIFRTLSVVIGVICLIAGIVSIALDYRNFGSLLLLGAVLSFFWFYMLNGTYKTYKKVYLEYLPANKVSEMLHFGSFKFTDESLIYESKRNHQDINWTDILNYKVVNSIHIVMFRKNKDEHNLIISETQMDASDFQKVLGFLKEKVKKRPYDSVFN